MVWLGLSFFVSPRFPHDCILVIILHFIFKILFWQMCTNTVQGFCLTFLCSLAVGELACVPDSYKKLYQYLELCTSLTKFSLRMSAVDLLSHLSFPLKNESCRLFTFRNLTPYCWMTVGLARVGVSVFVEVMSAVSFCWCSAFLSRDIILPLSSGQNGIAN